MTAQHPDDILAMRMAETARIERKRAAERDGIYPGGKPEVAPDRGSRSDAGDAARALLAENPDLTPFELAQQTGITRRGARYIIERSGRRLELTAAQSAAGHKARAILAAEPDISTGQLMARSGLSRSACRDLTRTARGGPMTATGMQRSPGRLVADRMAAEGHDIQAIIAATGVARETARRAVVEAVGAVGVPSRTSPPRQKADRMAAAGASKAEIMLATGVSETTARRAINAAKGRFTA